MTVSAACTESEISPDKFDYEKYESRTRVHKTIEFILKREKTMPIYVGCACAPGCRGGVAPAKHDVESVC